MGISKGVAKATKLAEKANLDNFAPRAAKLARRGQNTVSAERALIGEKITSQAFRNSAGSLSATDELSTRALSARGPAGTKAARNDIARVALKGKPSDKEIAYDTLVRRADDNAIHRADALRNERSTTIQFNGGGYTNPAMRKQAVQGMPNPNVGSFSGGYTPHNQVFGQPQYTGSAAMLAKRM